MATLRPPQQPRSEASLGRLLAATRELLEAESFGQLTVARIARRANSSVGVFYSRFAGKQALLEHLAELYAREANEAVRAFGAQPGRALPDELRAVVRFALDFHRARAGWIRALLQEARTHPEGPVARRVRGLKALPPTIERRVLAHAPTFTHPEPARAVAAGFFLVVSAVRERVLFGEGGTAGARGREGDADLVELLASAWLAILTRAPAGATPPGRGGLYS